MTGKDLDLENLPNDDEEQWEKYQYYWIYEWLNLCSLSFLIYIFLLIVWMYIN